MSGYCFDCHNDVEQIADLSLERLDLGAVAADRETWEKVVRKLRGGMMPPADGPRPQPEAYLALTTFLEGELDAGHEPVLPSPGLHRLNRAEYANAVRDLLALLSLRDIGSRDTIYTLAGVTWQAVDYADGLVRVGVQSAIAHPETGALIRRLMQERGLPIPVEGRTLDSICVMDLCR